MTTLPPTDPDLPELRLLLGDEAPRLLSAGLDFDVAAARPGQIRYVPGRSVTVAYQLEPAAADSPATAVARAGGTQPEGATVVSDDDVSVAVWTPRTDPRLPGLASVLDRPRLGGLLTEVGVSGAIDLIRIRSYRPGRRAVVEVSAGGHRLFIKAVRPDRVAALQKAHVAISPHIRVPRSLGWSPELGLAVLEALPGRSLRASISQPNGRPLPAWGQLAALLNRLPDLPGQRPGLVERLPTHVGLLGQVVPAEKTQLDEFLDHIGSAGRAESGPAHNDFHSEQILVSEAGIGLIDIDTAARGARIDDAALLLGHLFTSALDSASTAAIADYGKRLLGGCEQEFDRRDLRLRVAAAVLAFATAPFRRLQDDWPEATRRRIQAATEWAESAG